MDGIAQVAAVIGAVTYLAAAPVEMFFFGRPAAQRFLHVEATHVEDVRMWAFVVGFRNALGTIVGVVLVQTDREVVGEAVVLTGCAYMLLASLAMGLADLLGYWRPRGGSVLGTVASSLPPLVALVAAAAVRM